MFKYFDLILIATILMVITIIIGMKLIQGPMLIAMVALSIPFLVTPLYRKCTSSRKKLQKYTFGVVIGMKIGKIGGQKIGGQVKDRR